MILKKGLLTVFYKTLATSKPAKFSIARVRDALTKKVFDELHTFENDRKNIYEAFCVKDEDGKPLITNGMYSFELKTPELTKKNVAKMQKEVEILSNEEIEIKIDNQDIIKNTIENTEFQPNMEEVELIEELLLQFESKK